MSTTEPLTLEDRKQKTIELAKGYNLKVEIDGDYATIEELKTGQKVFSGPYTGAEYYVHGYSMGATRLGLH